MSANRGPIGVGIAGLGRSGWDLHAKTLASLPHLYTVAGVTDPIAARCAEAADRFGCRTSASIGDLAAADDVELVVVATPSQLHTVAAIEVLERRKHVVVEKPFATSLSDVDAILGAADRAGLIATASQNLRYTADFLKVREVVDSGRLGHLVEVKVHWHAFRRRWDWQTMRCYGGGTVNNDASHAVDQALVLLGDCEPQVWAHLAHTPLCLGDAEDHAKIVLSGPGLPLVDLEFSNACAYPQDRWLVLGTLGALTGGPAGLRWRYVDPASMRRRRARSEPSPDRGYDGEELRWTEESCDLAGETYTQSHVRMYRDLYATVREGRPLAITPNSIRRQVAVLEQCRAVETKLVEGEPQ
ncbi:MAG: Gfo/Idh/MocA family protein [Labedaea sp.]